MADRKRTKKLQLIFVIILIIMLTLSLSSSIIVHLWSGWGNQDVRQQIQKWLESTWENKIDFDVSTWNIDIKTGNKNTNTTGTKN